MDTGKMSNKDELIALSRAMGTPQPDYYAPANNITGYRPNDIPDMVLRDFWSASVKSPLNVNAYFLDGHFGKVDHESLDSAKSVRCVR